MTVSQRRFRFAFVVVTAGGETPTADQLAQLDSYRTQFEAYFQKAASQNATADTTLKKAVHVSAFPAVGVMQGGAAPIRIELETVAPASTVFALRTKGGLVQAPQSVTIPAGAREVTFTAAGISEGADEIQLEPADASYESVTAKVQVLPAAKLQLSALSESSPIRIKVTDANELPYPGVTVQALATNGGSLDRSNGFHRCRRSRPVPLETAGRFGQSTSGDCTSGPSLTITAGVPPVFTTAAVLNAGPMSRDSYPEALRPSSERGWVKANAACTDQRHDGTATFWQRRPTQLRRALGYTHRNGGYRDSVGQQRIASSTIAGTGDTATPGIFFDSSTGLGAIRQNGGYLEIYATGLGALTTTRDVTIAGIPAEVVFSGLAPGFTACTK